MAIWLQAGDSSSIVAPSTANDFAQATSFGVFEALTTRR